MAPELASVVDAIHALVMVLWVLGLPLLFWHRWPRMSIWYGRYAVLFIALNLASRWLLGECFLTTLSRWVWRLGSVEPHEVPSEWFTVRFAEAIFHMTPSHEAIKRATEALILVTACGMLWTMRRTRGKRGNRAERGDAPTSSRRAS